MDFRQRVLRTVLFQDVDELPFRHAYGLMPGVLQQWHSQGLPTSVHTEKDIYEHFGFPTRSCALPLNVTPDPPFETKVIEQTDEYRISTDHFGRTTKVIYETSTLPLTIEFPVTDAHSWREYKKRLGPTSQSVGDDLEAVVQQNIASGHINSFGMMGFYWFPRDLMGDEQLCLAYYEQPELIHDILDTWCGLIEKVLTAALKRVRLDQVHFGEDMAYRNASMVSKGTFDEFIKPYYQRIHKIVQRYDVPIFSVDSDGCIDQLSQWFTELGVNLIGPNEVQAGNDIVAYRKKFGKKLAYDGGLDKLAFLEGRDAVDRMLHETIPFMKQTGGGWIVCLDHRVVSGTRLTDFQYYVDTVRKMIKS